MSVVRSPRSHWPFFSFLPTVAILGADGSRLSLFLDETWEDSENVRHFNSVPAEMFLRMLLPKMITRKRGIVINVSSLASKHAMYYPSYSAGKASINQLTDMLVPKYQASPLKPPISS